MSGDSGFAVGSDQIGSNPEDFIHIFVKNTPKLIEFLEYIAEARRGNCSPEIHNTLLELYLHSYKNEVKEDVSFQMSRNLFHYFYSLIVNPIQGLAIKETQILKLLKSADAKYEVEQAMILCQMNHFDAGMLYLYERAKLFKQILKYFIDSNDQIKVLETCERYGNDDPNLWIDALWYFSTTDETDRIIQVLNRMYSSKLTLNFCNSFDYWF